MHHHIAQFLFSCCVIIILSASDFVNAKMRLVISQFEGILRIMLKSSHILVYNKKKRTGGILYARMYKKKRIKRKQNAGSMYFRMSDSSISTYTNMAGSRQSLYTPMVPMPATTICSTMSSPAKGFCLQTSRNTPSRAGMVF